MRIILASHNPGKHMELNSIFSDLDVELLLQSEFGISPATEDGKTFIENALIKAREACRMTNMPAIADDSGLLVDALQGNPGLHTARFGGEHLKQQERNAKLLSMLGDNPNRQAHFHCTMVFIRYAEDPNPIIAQGNWYGEIATKAHGKGGFGYDPIFYLPDYQCTAAELDSELKNQISHRGQASAQLKQALQRELIHLSDKDDTSCN